MHCYSEHLCYTTGIRAKNPKTTRLLIALRNQSCCFQYAQIYVVGHSSKVPVVLENKNIPIEGCSNVLHEVALEDVYYGNELNMTLYEVQICLPANDCVTMTIYEIDEQAKVIKCSLISHDQLVLLPCQH